MPSSPAPPHRRCRWSQDLGLSSEVIERALEAARDLPGLANHLRDERDRTAAELRDARTHAGVLLEEAAQLRRVVALKDRRIQADADAITVLRRQLAGVLAVA